MLARLKAKIKALWQNKMTRNYVWVLLGQNAGSVFSILSLTITLRLISVYDYGSLVIIQTYAALISGIFGLRTFNGIIKFSSEAEQDGSDLMLKKYLNTAILLDFLSGAVAFGCSFALLKPIAMFMEWDLSTISLIHMYLPVILFTPIVQGAPIGVLRKLGYFRHINICHAIVYGVQFAFLALYLALGLHSFELILLTYAGTHIAESIVLFVYAFLVVRKQSCYRKFWKAGFTGNKAFWKYNFSFGVLLTFDQLLGHVSTLLINKYAGNFATAYIKVITRICAIFTKLTAPISQIFYPELCDWIAQKKYRKAYKLSEKYFYIVLSGGATLVFLLFITFDIWIPIFEASMAAAKYESLLYFIYTLLTVSFISFHQMSFALNMMRTNLITVGLLDVAYIVLLIPAILHFGVYGYLVLQILQAVLVFVIKLLVMRRIICKSERSEQTIAQEY